MAIRFSLISTSEFATRHVFLVLVTALLAACSAPTELAGRTYAYVSTDALAPSRDTLIPVTFVTPTATKGTVFPLVVIAHGHGGTRHENGAFVRIAEGLAEQGIASVRMDFPGCGDSSEPFSENNLGNMLADVLASRDFAYADTRIDKDRVGLFGWSMGGRLVLLLGDRNEDFKAIATWAPAASNGAGSMVSFLGGQAKYNDYRQRASRDGTVTFTTQWGQNQRLGLQWFVDLEDTQPLQSASAFTGPLLVLYGNRDDVVLPEVSEAVIGAAVNSSHVVRHVVEGADHGLGIYSGDESVTGPVIAATVQFLADNL